MKRGLIYFALVFVSCNNLAVISNYDIEENVRLEKSSNYEPRIESSYTAGSYGAYSNYFKETDNLIGLSSSKPGQLSSHRIFGYTGPLNMTKTKVDNTSDFKVEINGEVFTKEAFTKSSASDLHSVFGAINQFTISPHTLTKASSENNHVVEMYIPKEITITNPYWDSKKNKLPLCYYDGFHLEWNKDEKNANGVILILEWIGEVVVGRDVPSTHVRRTCIFDDTGKAILPVDLFEGIPDTAVCHITLLRGNIDVLSIENVSYKIQVESHEYMSFILIREIKYV